MFSYMTSFAIQRLLQIRKAIVGETWHVSKQSENRLTTLGNISYCRTDFYQDRINQDFQHFEVSNNKEGNFRTVKP